MSKLQQALDTLESVLCSGYPDEDTKLHNDAQAELNDYLQLYSAVHDCLKEYTLYPMNIKEMTKMVEETLGMPSSALDCHGLTQ